MSIVKGVGGPVQGHPSENGLNLLRANAPAPDGIGGCGTEQAVGG